MSLQIVPYNTPILRRKGARISAFDDVLRAFATDLAAGMHEAGGIGLAAQQLGKALMVCVVDLRASEAEFDWKLDGRRQPKDIFMPMFLVNPVVTPGPGAVEDVVEEGCLSFPGIRGEVPRPSAISAVFQDEFGTAHKIECNGLFARCIQHEVDHLNGILFIDRMSKKTRSLIDPAVRDLAKKTKAETARGTV